MTLRQVAGCEWSLRDIALGRNCECSPRPHTGAYFRLSREDCFATSIRICAFLLLLYCDVSNEILWFTRDARLAWRYSVYENIRSPL